MKKTIKKNIFISSLLFALAISITFTSCSKNNDAYKKEIETADALFKKQQYDEAKTHYVNALKLKKDEMHPTSQIGKINIFLSEIKNRSIKKDTKVKETKIVIVEPKATVKNPFVVVIASYAIESNAFAHQNKLNSNGHKTSIVKSSIGNFLISLQAFNTLTKSYNYLESLDLSDDYDIDEAWVYEIK
jgi:hypothetical protein